MPIKTGRLWAAACRRVFGPPDVDEIGAVLLQQGRKIFGTGQNVVTHTVPVTAPFGLLAGVHTDHCKLQGRVVPQGSELTGQPTTAHIAGSGQPASGSRLRQGHTDKP